MSTREKQFCIGACWSGYGHDAAARASKSSRTEAVNWARNFGTLERRVAVGVVAGGEVRIDPNGAIQSQGIPVKVVVEKVAGVLKQAGLFEKSGMMQAITLWMTPATGVTVTVVTAIIPVIVMPLVTRFDVNHAWRAIRHRRRAVNNG